MGSPYWPKCGYELEFAGNLGNQDDDDGLTSLVRSSPRSGFEPRSGRGRDACGWVSGHLV